MFATTEDLNFVELPVFVSPSISQLSLAGWDVQPVDDSGKLKKWALFTLIIILLLILGTIFWIVLHAWYQKKYEDYLFKNKNNLYNLFNWIANAQKRGLDEGKMKAELKGAGWSAEQLRYALRKYAGKKTGMPDLPINKIIEKSKKRNNMAQGGFPPKVLGGSNLRNQQPKRWFNNSMSKK
jgi:hypothetical protein